MFLASIQARGTLTQAHTTRLSGRPGPVEVSSLTEQGKPNAEIDLITDFSWPLETKTAT